MGPFGPAVVVPLGAFAMTIVIVIFVPLVRAFARKIENESKVAPIPQEVMSRLERMEAAIDSIAVEVERISEGQRFTTKLLSEGARASALPAVKDQLHDRV